MDAKNLQRSLATLVTALRELRDLREHRTGGKDNDALRADMDALNAGIARGNGMLLQQKLAWFHHDSLRRELGNLKVIMQALQSCLDEDVRQELAAEGASPDKIARHIESSLDWITVFRGAVDRHEQLVAEALSGKPTSAGEIASLENRLLRFNDWEEKVSAMGTGALAKIAPYAKSLGTQEPSMLRRIAASIVLPLAAAAAMMFSASPAYSQDIAKGDKPVITVNDQISILESKLDKTPDEYLKLTELYTKADRLDKATATINDYLKSNPNDIRALVQKRDLDGKKGLGHKHPDEDLLRIINSFDGNEYRKLIGQKSYQEIIKKLEPSLSTIFSYDWSTLSSQQKENLGDILNALGGAYYSLGKHNLALDACLADIAITPASPGSYSIIGSIFWMQKQYDKSIEAYKNVVKYNPQSTIGYAGLAECHFAISQYTEASAAWEIAITKATTAEKKEKYQQKLEECRAKLNR